MIIEPQKKFTTNCMGINVPVQIEVGMVRLTGKKHRITTCSIGKTGKCTMDCKLMNYENKNLYIDANLLKSE
jgi:hypothetical protein